MVRASTRSASDRRQLLAKSPTSTRKSSSPASKKASGDEKPPSAADLADASLDGEIEDTVPIFDTCDDVRKKIRDHLAKPGVTQAGLSRDSSELVHLETIDTRGWAELEARLSGPF